MGVLDKTITVAKINHAAAGKKRNVVISTDGETFGVWPEKIALFKVGNTYDVEIDERVLNGMVLHNITDARPSDKPAAATSPDRQAGKQTSRQVRQADNSEQIFVCCALKELIRAGEVKNDKRQLWETTNMLRQLWQHTFGAEAEQNRRAS